VLDTLSQITWILAGFAIGVILRRANVAAESESGFLFRLIFYVCVPALAFASLSTVDLDSHLLIFSALPISFCAVGIVAGRLIAPRLDLQPLQVPVFIMLAMGVNSIFVLPFALSIYGTEGAARYIAYDMVAMMCTYIWTYSVAVRANPSHHGMKGVVRKKLLRSPPLYGIVAGLAVNAFDVNVPAALANTALTFSAPTGFLVTLATGIALKPVLTDVPVAAKVILARTGTALIIALLFVAVFDLQGIDRTMVLLFAVAPLTFSSVTFSSLENLDVRFAAASLSISLVVGIVFATSVALTFA
jgi:predicted permease